jgi:hypothetical protein
MPPGMTLPGLMAMHGAGALAGIDAATLAGGGQALAYELYSKGIIGLPQYKQMLAGTGQAGPLDADIAAEAAVKGHQLAAGATLGSARIQADASMANQRLVTGETRHEFEQKPLPYVDENGVTRYVPQVQAPGKQYFEPTVAAERQRQGGAYGQYITPEKPGGTTMRAADAAAQGVPAVPQSLDQQNAILDAAIQQASRAGNQDEVRRLTNVKLQLATLPKGPVAAKEADEQAQVNYRNDQAHYPQPDPTTAVDMYVKAPVMFKPEAERAITERMKQLRGTDRYLTLNATELRSEARQQLEDENVLYKPEEINALRREDIRAPGGRDPRIQRVQPVGAAAPSDHMMIGLKPKGGTTTGGTTTGGTTAAEPPISTVVAPRPDKNRQINRASVPGRPAGAARATTAAPATTAATPAGPPPGATGKLPAGTPDGPFRLQSGEVGTALGGYYIPPTR